MGLKKTNAVLYNEITSGLRKVFLLQGFIQKLKGSNRMDAKELSRLSKTDLLELMLEMSRENDRLKRKISVYEKVVNDNKIDIEESGSIAEAALKINGVFEAAQAAADQYLDNIIRMHDEMEKRLSEMRQEESSDGKE